MTTEIGVMSSKGKIIVEFVVTTAVNSLSIIVYLPRRLQSNTTFEATFILLRNASGKKSVRLC